MLDNPTTKEKAAQIAAKWWQDLIEKENCSSTEEAIEKAVLEMAEFKKSEFRIFLEHLLKLDSVKRIHNAIKLHLLSKERDHTEERCPYLIAYNGKYSCVSSIIGPKCKECYIKYPRDYE